MKIIRKTAGFLGRNFLDIRGALGVEQLRQSFSILGTGIKSVFKPISAQGRTHETFNDAVTRLGLSSNDIQARYQIYRKGFYGYTTAALFLLLYCVYLLITGYYDAALVCLAVFLLTVIFAFRRHFWMFQIRQQKLGCTVREWFNATFYRQS